MDSHGLLSWGGSRQRLLLHHPQPACWAGTSGAAHEASPCGGYWSKKAPCSFSY
jgi:hypothetical protein